MSQKKRIDAFIQGILLLLFPLVSICFALPHLLTIIHVGNLFEKIATYVLIVFFLCLLIPIWWVIITTTVGYAKGKDPLR